MANLFKVSRSNIYLQMVVTLERHGIHLPAARRKKSSESVLDLSAT